MIRFACRCSQVLELPDDMAGLSTQCPKCGLLLDVPALSDMDAIEKDGTYRLDNQPKPKVDEHLKELTTVYFPGRQLPDGSEIDLRGPVQPPASPLPPAGIAADSLPAERPKYNPETGELIVPIDIDQDQPKPPAHPSEIPTARRVINYTTSDDQAPQALIGLGVFARLFQPVNVVVMGVVLLMHVGIVLLALVTNFVIFIIFAPFALLLVLIGHYAMLVEEMGPTDRDELPRPLRSVHLYDDFFAPFAHMASSLLLCYWPSLLIILINFSAWSRGEPFPFPRTRELHLGLFAAGSLLFPAVLQTICTSGNIVNLRPDRVLGVIRVTGLRYLPIAILWMIGSIALVTGQIAVLVNWVLMLGPRPNAPLIAQPYIAYPLLMAGVYLLHAFGWILGLEYRRAHSHYPWALQQHTHTPEMVQAPSPPQTLSAEQAAQEQAARRTKFKVR